MDALEQIRIHTPIQSVPIEHNARPLEQTMQFTGKKYHESKTCQQSQTGTDDENGDNGLEPARAPEPGAAQEEHGLDEHEDCDHLPDGFIEGIEQTVGPAEQKLVDAFDD